ncbi:MAG: AzlC family ABC transporter permease [Alphaproteobacteria bacterium]|nr:AzlC family ABC transporter permease [Alphaproteobacteria bacterium]
MLPINGKTVGPIARGVIDATGMPALVLFASMVGYGSMAREAGLTLWTAIASTGLTWGLPGQIAMVELYALGAPMLAIVAASSAANARFLPMVLSVMPLFNEALPRKRWRYVVAQFMSLNPWAAIMRRGPGMTPADRPPYYAGFAGVCITAALLGTGAGFILAGAMSRNVTLTLVFLNPVFFTLVFADARGRAAIMAVLAGVVAGPLFHLLSPDWGLLLTGAVAGTGAYMADRALRRRYD